MTSGHSSIVHFQPILAEIRTLLQQSDWNVQVEHVYREANRCADLLAKHGHGREFDCQYLDAAPGFLKLCLVEDAIGCRSLRRTR